MLHLPRKVFRPKESVNPLSELRNTGIVSSPEVHIAIMAAILNLVSLFARKMRSGAPAREIAVTDTILCVDLKSDYAHFFPISSRPAFLRSSEVMTTLNSTFALKVRNHGSARVGIFDGSDISTIMTAPR